MSSSLIPLRGEIYWANLEPVEGSEQGGNRPVFIISNTLMNETAPIVLIIPMTRTEEKVKVGPFNILLPISTVDLDNKSIDVLKGKNYLFAPQDGVLLCNQARAVSKSRMLGRVGKCTDIGIIRKIEEALKHSFALEACEVCGVPLRPGGLSCGRCGQVYRVRCLSCNRVCSNQYNFCPQCGRRLK